MVVIATVATVVASQALISGAFSLTRQAVQLGYSPRVTIIHTSGKTEGQIYIPEVNKLLMVSCVALVLAFRESSNLAAAYGIAVTGTMSITSLLFYMVARERWGWSRLAAGSVLVGFLIFDLGFLSANLAKITHGGWFPLVVAAGIFIVLTTWKRGRALLQERMRAAMLPLDVFMADLGINPPIRVRGTAVFLNSSPDGTPIVLLHHFKHNKVLHEQIVLLSVLTDSVPEVPKKDRVQILRLEHGFWRVTAHYGFMQTPNVPEILKRCRKAGLKVDEADTSYYLGRETLISTSSKGLARWRKILFGFFSRNARPATAFFGLPPNRVVEMGAQIEL
jgi:KUP system potassium uptake protein